MTRYQDLNEAFYKTTTARHTLHHNVKRLPEWLLDAVREELEAPEGEMAFLTEMYGQPIGYVFFARRNFDDCGYTKWEPVTDGKIYRIGETGFSTFGLGVALEEQVDSWTPWFIHVGLHIEVQNESLVHLFIDGTDTMMPLVFGKPETFKRAAKVFVDFLYDYAKDLAGRYKQKSAIGFNRIEEE